MTIDKAKLKVLAEGATKGDWRYGPGDGGDENPIVFTDLPNASGVAITILFESDWATDTDAAFVAESSPQVVLALLAEIDQLKAENELMRALIGDAATELRKASAWVCREVEAGTKCATHWAVRLRERADLLDAAMAKEAPHG